METERLISLVGKNATRDAVPRPLLRLVVIISLVLDVILSDIIVSILNIRRMAISMVILLILYVVQS